MNANRIMSTLRWVLIAAAVTIAAVAPTAAAVEGDTTWLYGTEFAVTVLLLSGAMLHAFVALILGPRRRPVVGRAAGPRRAPRRAPGTTAPHPAFKGCVGWGAPTPGRHFPAGWARRPAAVGLPNLPGTAAGPTLATVPAGGTP